MMSPAAVHALRYIRAAADRLSQEANRLRICADVLEAELAAKPEVKRKPGRPLGSTTRVEKQVPGRLRPAKAAERLGVSLPTFWRYARTVPDFPKLIKISSAVTVVDAAELDAFVERRKT